MTFWPARCCEILRPLKHVCRLNPDILSESTDPDFEFEYIDIGNVSLEAGVVASESMKFENSPSRARKPVQPGDVIVSTVRTYLKAVAAIRSNAKDWVVSTGFAVLRKSPQIEPRYLYRVVQSNPFVEAVVAASTGVSYPAISSSALGNILIPIPDLDTQKAIADFLDQETDRIDQLIMKKVQLVNLLEERERGLLYSVTTGKFGPYSDDNPKPVAASWFSALPRSWTVRRIKTLTPVMRGASPRPIDDPIYFEEYGEFAWVRIADVTASGGALRFTTQRLSQLGAAKSVKLQPGSLFLSIAGSVGKPCITEVKACIHDGFVYFPMLPKATQRFLYYIFRNGECFGGLGKLGTQLNLNTETVGNISIPFPPIELQAQLGIFLDQEIAKIAAAQLKTAKSIELLCEFRSALITAAVTGQVDVTTWGKQGQTDRRLVQIEEAMRP
jgi:type I restriction enzyme S subunit